MENGDDKRQASVKRTSPGKYEVTVDEKKYNIVLPISLSQPTVSVRKNEHFLGLRKWRNYIFYIESPLPTIPLSVFVINLRCIHNISVIKHFKFHEVLSILR